MAQCTQDLCWSWQNTFLRYILSAASHSPRITHTFSFMLQSFKDTWYWSQKYFSKRILSLLHLLENNLSTRVIQIYGEKKNKTDLAAPASASSSLQTEFLLSLVEESCTKQTALLWFSCFLSSVLPSQPQFSSKYAMALLLSVWRSGFLGHS